MTTSHSATPTAPRTGPLTTGPNVRPGEKPPELPAAAKSHEEFSAARFAEYFFRAFDWSIATNDPTLLKHYSATTCKWCSHTIRDLDTLNTEHKVLLGGRVTIVQSGVILDDHRVKSERVALVEMKQGAETVVSSDGTRKSVAQASHPTGIVYMSWQENHWVVLEVLPP
jgi:hypothetical protein